MKMNIRGWLLAPWIVFFVVIIAGIIVAGSRYHFDLRLGKYSFQLFVLAIIYCSYLNFKSITKAGIWISYSIPKNLKPTSWHWLMRVLVAALVSFIFYKIGQISWVPLYWQGFVLPIVFSVSLMFIIANILSPILIWCANLPFIRLSAILSSIPILLFIPVSGIYMGGMILRAYEASLPKPFILEQRASLESAAINEISINNKNENNDKIEKSDKNSKSVLVKNIIKDSADKNSTDSKSVESTKKTDVLVSQPNLMEPRNEKAIKLKALALSKTSCVENSAEIQSALNEKNPDEVVYWATQALGCANLKPIPALTKLVDIMLKGTNPKVRASAIMAMAKFKNETVEKLGYLLVKQIGEKHPPVVIEAASYVYSRLGGTEYNTTMRKLKVLLSHPNLHREIADIMVRVMNREDLILEYVVTSLNESNEKTPVKMAAVEMVCALPKKSLTELNTHVDHIVSLIGTGDSQDPAKKALDCLGSVGINAIRNEIKTPKILNRVAAARVLSHMDIKNSKDVLDTVSACIHDRDEELRKECSTSLGKVGVAALPKIMDLISASKDEDKKYGEQALNSLVDPEAKQDLLKIRAKNSGWSATQKKLGLVRSIDTTLVRIEDVETQLRHQQEERKSEDNKSTTIKETGKTTL
jgi:hypothetical protein